MTTWASGTLPIRTRIQNLVDDGSVETSGSLYSSLLPWANEIIIEIATELNIRELLASDATGIAFTTSDYYKAVPSDFMKSSFRFTKFRVSDDYVDIIGIEELFTKDPNHDETTSASLPDYCAIEGRNIYVYPMFTGTGYLTNYYRIPTDMSADGDTPDIPAPDHIRTELVVTGVCGKYVFPHLGEFELANRYYKKSVYPPEGRFFELLRDYENVLGASASVWSNRNRFY